ncbi:NAD-dependent epimerase/dehydratase family protein [Comamonas jiangduensis]|uniref:NAD-dependent epimerase/dehydratase family protein n=1 Tax=Comamonas jiangduensis TaxID=1194168 RepID=UPI0024E1676C|nr:NAD(P)-dependent oxidoreductase [Comamonas jiangduensis]
MKNLMERRALVTGATGYIGAKLCQRLLDDGWVVSVLVRNSGRPLATSLTGRVTIAIYDGSIESVLTAIRESKPTIVFHLASLFIAEHHSEQVTNLIASNVLFGTQLAEACVREEIKNFINTGTSWQHYRSNDYDPVCLYAATKQAFEDILDFYTDAFPLSAVTLKLFDTYGYDDPRPKLINLLIKTALTKDRLGISPGEQLVDLVYIDDVISAFTCCAKLLVDEPKKGGHERYAISSGRLVSVRKLVKLLEKISGQSLNVISGARPYRKREVMVPWRSGKLPPGWLPHIDLETGLRILLNSTNSSLNHILQPGDIKNN